jgi:hypothetical protein
MTRLREALRPLDIPVDGLVISRKTLDEWFDELDTVIYEARQERRVLRDAP